MQLPVELVESVIDASAAHHPTLSACSLVCKQWLPRCRHHLFSTLDLSADWTPEPNSVTNFLALLLTPHAAKTLIPYVRSVVVAKRSWGMTPVARILTALARAGVHPRALLVNCPSYEPTHAPVFASSLTHLTLELHNDMRAAPLIEYICAFQGLQVLDVGGSARFAFDEEMLSAHYARRVQLPACLHTLIVRNTVVAECIVATALEVAPSDLSVGITTLVVRHVRSPEQWQGVYRYLTTSACAGIVRSLTFQGCDFVLQPPTPLPPLPSLRTLTIECSTTSAGAHLSMLLPYLPPHAKATPLLPALEVFTLRFTNAFLSAASPSSAIGDPRAWADVDKRLASLTPNLFPALERVCVARVGLSASVSGGRRNSNAEVYGRREGRWSHLGSGLGDAGEGEEGRPLPKAVADVLRREMGECVRRGLLFV